MSFQWFYTDVRDLISASFIIAPSQYMSLAPIVLREEIRVKRERALLSLERQATTCANERGWQHSTLLLRSWNVICRESEDDDYHTRDGYVFESVIFDECVMLVETYPGESFRPVMSVHGKIGVGFVREKRFHLVQAPEVFL